LPSAGYHYACDRAWWNLYYNDVKETFKNDSYTINDVDASKNPDEFMDLIRLDSVQKGGLGRSVLHYGIPGGGNSGHQAINLAYILGAEKVLLLGFDMGGDHYFGKHPKKLVQNSPFESFKKSLATINEIEVINCTPRTALNCFPRMSLESALSSVQGKA